MTDILIQTIIRLSRPCRAGAIVLCGLLAHAPASSAIETFALGVTLNASGWEGDNGPGRSDFASDEGGQFGFSLNFRGEKFYTGISLQGGGYEFDSTVPDQFTSNGTISSRNAEVRHEDFDLLVGYYFWPRVSLFLDLKVATSEWQNTGYEQAFSGLGFGLSGFHPLDHDWLLFGSIGFVNGDLDDNDVSSLGDGKSSAMVVGAVYRVDEDDTINFGLKLRSYDFDYADGNRQDYSLNGLFFGYNHIFDW